VGVANVVDAFKKIHTKLYNKRAGLITHTELVKELRQMTGYGKTVITNWVAQLGELDYIKPVKTGYLYRICFNPNEPGIFVDEQQIQKQKKLEVNDNVLNKNDTS